MSSAATDSSGAAPTPAGSGPEEQGYLDAASGLPLSRDARSGLSAAWAHAWADPSRRYPAARRSRRMLDTARQSVAHVLGIPAEGVLFPGSVGTAVAWALSGWGRRRLLVSAVEELSVLRTADSLQQRGAQVQILPVDRLGRIDPRAAAAAAALAPAVLVVQDVNVEIGTRQPLQRLRECLAAPTPIMVDVRGSLGREPHTDQWDALIGDARQWGGPADCAVLALRDPGAFRPDTPATDGHLGLEPADPPVALIAAAALALESGGAADWQRLAVLSRRMREQVVARIPDAELVGGGDSAWISMFTFLYVAAEELIDALARRGWSCASGASCTSDTRRPNHVLTEVGAATHGSLRVSLPPWTDGEAIDAFVADLVETVAALRRDAGTADL